MAQPADGKNSKVTRKESYSQVARQLGTMPEEARLPPFPKECGYIWEWACELHRRGDSTSSDIKSFFDIRNITPTVDEVHLIYDLLGVFK